MSEPEAPSERATLREDRHGEPSMPVRSRWRVLTENLISLLLAVLIVLMVRSSVIEAFKIPSGSMIPTLLVGDHIFVNKFAYGVIVPFTDWIGPEPIYVFRREQPKRGDIIVFKWPKNEDIYYIKRVIGTPGDTVELRGKALYINGARVEDKEVDLKDKERLLRPLEGSEYTSDNMEIYRETLQSASPTVMVTRNSYNWEWSNFGPITLPPDNFFVLGDNRDNSKDSRFWGFVPMRDIKGKAMVIWLSLWMDFSEKEFYFRPGRTGTVLE